MSPYRTPSPPPPDWVTRAELEDAERVAMEQQSLRLGVLDPYLDALDFYFASVPPWTVHVLGWLTLE